MSYFDAFRTEQHAPMLAWGEPSQHVTTFQDPLTEDEESDEEMDMAALRRKAKAVSEEAVACGCLPAASQHSSKKLPFASMKMLSEAADLLGKIVAPQPEAQSAVSNIWQKLQAADLLPGFGATTFQTAPGGSVCPSSSSRAEPLHTTMPPNKSSPFHAKPSAAHRHSEAVKASKCPEFFCLDAQEEESSHASARDSSLACRYDSLSAKQYTLDDSRDAESCSASCRSSSLTHSYDALEAGVRNLPRALACSAGNSRPVRPPNRGAARERNLGQKSLLAEPSGDSSTKQYTLDDSCDAESCSASCHSSSLTHSYDALEASFRTLPRTFACSAGNLRPVRPPSRGATWEMNSAQKSLWAEPLGPSAMGLDICLSSNTTTSRRSNRSRGSTPAAHKHQFRSLGASLRVTKSVSSTKLPPLAAAMKGADDSHPAKSGFTMKAGSGAQLWDVPSLRPAMGLSSRSIVF